MGGFFKVQGKDKPMQSAYIYTRSTKSQLFPKKISRKFNERKVFFRVEQGTEYSAVQLLDRRLEDSE